MHRWTTQLIPPELMGAHIASAQSHTTLADAQLPPERLVPPWGATRIGRDPYEQLALHAPTRFAAPRSPGTVLSGTAQAGVGLSAPVVDPEHTVLYLAEAIN
jgi:hypothetical protein